MLLSLKMTKILFEMRILRMCRRRIVIITSTNLFSCDLPFLDALNVLNDYFEIYIVHNICHLDTRSKHI